MKKLLHLLNLLICSFFLIGCSTPKYVNETPINSQNVPTPSATPTVTPIPASPTFTRTPIPTATIPTSTFTPTITYTPTPQRLGYVPITLENVKDLHLVKILSPDYAQNAVYSQDGKTIILPSLDRVCFLNAENLVTDHCIATVSDQNYTLPLLSELTSDNQLATSSRFEKIYIWDAKTGELLRTIVAAGDVSQRRFLPGTHILVAYYHTSNWNNVGNLISPDEGVQIWNADDGKLKQSCTSCALNDWPLGYLTFGKTFQIVHGENPSEVFQLQDGNPPTIINKLDNNLPNQYTVFSPDGEWVGSFSTGKVSVYSIKENKRVIYQNIGNALRFMTFSPDGSLFAYISKDGLVNVFHVNNGSFLETLTGRSLSGFNAIAFSPKGDYIIGLPGQLNALNASNANIHLWHVQDGKLLKVFDRCKGDVFNIYQGAFSPDDSHLAVCDGFNLLVWSLPENKLINSRFIPDLRSFSLSGNGKLLVSGGVGGIALVWDATNGKLIRTIREPQENQNSPYGITFFSKVSFSPDNRHIAVGLSDGHVELWDIESDSPPILVSRGLTYNNDINFSPDGKYLGILNISNIVTLKVWDVGNNRILLNARYPISQVNGPIYFTPDDKYLIPVTSSVIDIRKCSNPGDNYGIRDGCGPISRTFPDFTRGVHPNGMVILDTWKCVYLADVTTGQKETCNGINDKVNQNNGYLVIRDTIPTMDGKYLLLEIVRQYYYDYDNNYTYSYYLMDLSSGKYNELPEQMKGQVIEAIAPDNTFIVTRGGQVWAVK